MVATGGDPLSARILAGLPAGRRPSPRYDLESCRRGSGSAAFCTRVHLKVKSLLRKGFDKAGYYIGKKPMPNTLAHHLKYLFYRLQIDTVLDVGAHIGEYAAFLRTLGFNGPIISFEPLRESFEILSADRTRHDKAWKGLSMALGESNEVGTLNVMDGTDLSSFLEPIDSARDRFPGLSKSGSAPVEVRRLDSILGELTSSKKIFLKMDTQGFDLKVLQGSKNCLDQIRMIQTEVAAKPIYSGMPLMTEVIHYLQELGYDLTGLFPVSRETNNLSVVEFDLVAHRRG